MRQKQKARITVAACMATFGTLAPFVRQIELSSAQLALWRAVLAAVLLGGYLAVSRRTPNWRALYKALPALLLSGAAMGINWILLFEAYRYTTVAVATLSYYFAPVLVTVLSVPLYKEKISVKQAGCFAASTAGLFFIVGANGFGTGSSNALGVAFGLAAAAFYAGVILLNKSILQVGGIQRTFVQFLAAIVVLAPYVALQDGLSLAGLSCTGWLSLLVVGLLHTGLIYCLYFSAMEHLPGQELAILSYIDPLVSVAVSVAVLHEPLSPAQLLGGAMILGFTLLNERLADR
ncbi:MAG: DMT family transporter [Pygmaiobacter massiliensis]|nr:DMT family transporter [Pygmaiobacter massiliensis]